MAEQMREISIPEAIASAVNARKSMERGDQMGYILSLKQLELQAEKFEWDKRNDLLTQSQNAWKQQTAVDTEMRRQELDKEIRAAYESGDVERVRFLQSLQAGSIMPFEPQQRQATPVKPEEWDLMRQRFEAGEISQQQWDAFKNKQTGVIPAEPVEISTFQQKLKDLDSLGLPPEEYAIRFQQLLDDFVNKPRDTGSQTDAGNLLNRLEKYPAFGANRIALDRLTSLMPKDKGQKIGASIDAMLQGRSFKDIPQDQKDIIADSMAYIALSEPPGGDITQRFNFAQNLLKDNIPLVLKQYNVVRGKLGRLKQVEEGYFRFTGRTTDPDVARFQAIMERLVSDYVVLRSGAQITDNEFKRYLSTLPSVGNTAEVNDVMMSAMVDSLNSYFTGYFNTTLGDVWGKEATRVVMGGSGIEFDVVDTDKPSQLKQLTPEQAESILQRVIADPETSFDSMREELRRNGYDTTEFDKAIKERR